MGKIGLSHKVSWRKYDIIRVRSIEKRSMNEYCNYCHYYYTIYVFQTFRAYLLLPSYLFYLCLQAVVRILIHTFIENNDNYDKKAFGG